MSGPFILFTAFNADGTETEHKMPAKMAVCPRCDGSGTHTNPSIDGNGITASEMDELGDDFREDYMRGAYDVTCTQCHGKNVVPVADPSRASFAVRRAYVKFLRDKRESDREYESERWLRMAESGERYS